MKKTILLILVIFAIIFTFSACFNKPDNKPGEIEESYSKNLDYKLSDDGESYWVIGIGTCNDENIIIPSQYNGKPVTKIYDYAFYVSNNIKSVIIPDTVKSIGDYAFHTHSLENISLGKSVEEIGDFAIRGSFYMKISVSSENNHYKLIDGHLCTIDGKELVYYIVEEGDTKIIIPNGVEIVNNDSFLSFLYATNASLFTFNEYMGSKYIGSEENPYLMFYSAPYDINVELHKDTRIVYSLSDRELYIPDYITCICHNTYPGVKFEVDPNNEYYKSIDGSVYTKDGKTLISAYAKGTAFEIPEGVEHIADFAFSRYMDIESISMPDSVKSIGSYAFSSCCSLKSINLSKSLETIKYAAFNGCSALEDIEFPKSVKIIAPLAFNYCRSITDIEIPGGVEKIYNAFESCGSLTNVYIPDSVTIIGAGAFYGCSSLEAIIISDSVTTIGGNAFYGCSSLEEVIIPDSVTYLGVNAFSGCTSLKNVVIGNSVDNLDIDFSQCTSLESIVIGNSVQDIGVMMFAKCNALKSVTLGDNVKTIGYGAFSECYSLESINLPSSLTTISEKAFLLCTSLSSIVVPKSVTHVGKNAFYSCDSLTIYCEATSQPAGWNQNWNPHNSKVEWGYKK